MKELFHESTSLVSYVELALGCDTPSTMSVASPKAFVEEQTTTNEVLNLRGVFSLWRNRAGRHARSDAGALSSMAEDGYARGLGFARKSKTKS